MVSLFFRLMMSVVLFAMSLNYWFGFVELIPIMAHTPAAIQFVTAIYHATFIFPLIHFIQFIVAILILFNRFQLIALIMISPIAVVVLVYHIVLDPIGLPFGLLLVIPYTILLAENKRALIQRLFH